MSPTSSEQGEPRHPDGQGEPRHPGAQGESTRHGGVHPEGEGTRRAAEAGRRLREQRELQRFQRTFWIVSGVLGAVAAVFLLLGALQGPKLTTAQVDPQRATEQSGQQLRMFANQPLRDVDASQVAVSPQTDVTVTVQDDLLVVQFDERLRYDTEYTVTVSDVAARSRDAVSTFSHAFETAGASVLYLDRGETQDEILRAEVSGTGRGEVVHAAPGIQAFAPVEGVLVVARDAGAGGTGSSDAASDASAPGTGASVLESVLTESGDAETVRLPEGARVDRIIAPQAGTLVGLVLTEVVEEGTPQFSSALAYVDLAGDREVRLLEGLDGEPVRALDAAFLPGGSSLLVHALDQSLLRIDLLAPELVLPVDQLPTVWNLSTDGTRVSGSDSFGGLFLDLESGEETRLNPSLFEGEVVFGGETVLLSDERWVQKVAVPDASGGSFAIVVVVDDGSGESRQLARTIDDRGSIGALSVSPNDQYVAIEVTPSVEDAEPDGRRVNPRSTSITLQIIDIETGALVRSLEGFAPVW
ncbi:hypothetical protein [Chryseoglobus sp. 28M-23]|uniref:hypothetical protein n=1 Tax=Chryseoglobus sp. 28M-23 TaxID=2772253 RepID=UPI001745CC94|nr:hypothetical protein [Chryseoglobus sp. 28M-23]MBU1251522.1 hypothetical protein [Actinomycetota bacterium]MBU1608403.1 hypothetical protein [Actinomycetota bacterium]MBU2316475.1 hypothetical protein [Actinomycetota bacterium]MBU2384621.1 hypothetical protein [Actinomycetota bacterium]QOD92939.1 hypothetical protein IE160_08230 [Chryseoglobus sp. 28M-23]